jgi:CubicO group peptidase (beta-lactamase class C family)
MSMRLGPRAVAHALTLALALVLVGPAPGLAQHPLAESPAPTRYAPAIRLARALMQAMMEESGTPGMSVAVGIDGAIVWSEGFGFADVEQRVPVWEETKFRIGSVSKPVTAAAVGLLVEQGKLDLDAPVQRYVPSFPEKPWPITTREVAGHLAGIRHYASDEEFLSSKRYGSVLEGLAIFKDDTLLFEPGTRYSYSSYGWNLVSAVVEGASGTGFLALMRESVFDRLGMTHTVADHTDSIIPQRTRYYDRNEDGSIANSPYVDNSYKWAGGGYLSTPEDLVRFGFAHLRGDFLKPETVALLWTPMSTRDGQSTGYGIGWSVDQREGRVLLAAHGGGSIGGTAFLLILPEEKAVVAMMGNLTQAPTGYAAARMITDAFLDPEALLVAEPGPDIAGVLECDLSFRGEEVAKATLELRGTPGSYWGRIVSSNETHDRIVYSTSRQDATLLYSVDESGRLSRSTINAVQRNRLSGEWLSGGRKGELSCRRK